MPLVALIGNFDNICHIEKSSSQSKDSCNRRICKAEIKNEIEKLDVYSNVAYCSQGHITPMVLDLNASVTVFPQVKSSSVLWRTINNQYGSWMDLIFYQSKINMSFYKLSNMNKVIALNLKTIGEIKNPIIIEVIPTHTNSAKNNIISGALKTQLQICGPEMNVAEAVSKHLTNVNPYPSCYMVETNISFSIGINFLQFQGILLNLTILSTCSQINIYEIPIIEKKINVKYSTKSEELFNKSMYVEIYNTFADIIYATKAFLGGNEKNPKNNEKNPEFCSGKSTEISQYNIPEEDSEYSFWILSTTFEFDYIYFKAKVIQKDFVVKESILSWTDASRKCQAVGGYLPILRSKREIDDLISVIRDVEVLPLIEGLYIGLNNMKV